MASGGQLRGAPACALDPGDHSIDLELRIIPRLGDLPLTQLGPSVVERFAADLERDGTGTATIVSTLAALPGVMKRFVRDFNLPSNPVKQIDTALPAG